MTRQQAAQTQPRPAEQEPAAHVYIRPHMQPPVRQGLYPSGRTLHANANPHSASPVSVSGPCRIAWAAFSKRGTLPGTRASPQEILREMTVLSECCRSGVHADRALGEAAVCRNPSCSHPGQGSNVSMFTPGTVRRTARLRLEVRSRHRDSQHSAPSTHSPTKDPLLETKGWAEILLNFRRLCHIPTRHPERYLATGRRGALLPSVSPVP